MIAAIVCADKNWGIGYQGDLLCKIPEDMKHFKEITEKSFVFMGRKTYESLPNPLSNRRMFVITSNQEKTAEECTKAFECNSSILKLDLNYAKKVLEEPSNANYRIFIIGGGQIYKELLPYCDKVYVTKVDYEFENVDTYFPNLDELAEWHITEINPAYPAHEYKGLKYRFLVYEREKEM